MKQIVSNYSYSPTANCVTLTGLNIDQDQLLLVVAPGVGRTLYNFASVTGSVVAGTNTRINLTASTAGLTTTSPLVIYYDDQSAAQSVTGTVALDPASLISLENITVTVGSSVSISNFPSTQTIAGTVTANLSSSNLNSVTIGIKGTVTGNLISSVTPYIDGFGNGDPYPTGTQMIAVGGWTDEADGAHFQILKMTDAGQLVTYESNPNRIVSGAVTANINVATTGQQATEAGVRLLLQQDYQSAYQAGQKPYGVPIAFIDSSNSGPSPVYKVVGNYGALLPTSVGNSLTIGSLPAISGTVTANLSSVPTHGVTIANSSVTVNGTFYQATQPVSLVSVPTHGVTIAAGTAQIGSVTASIIGTVPVSGTFYQATQPVSIASLPASTVTVSSIPAISGTVTANVASTTVTVSALPKITLIDGSGSVVTADSAIQVFATSSTRSYLLVQVTTGSAYVNVGATATTANGIYLSSGQGYAWETTIPQGVVSLISSVTGTAYCAKQA